MSISLFSRTDLLLQHTKPIRHRLPGAVLRRLAQSAVHEARTRRASRFITPRVFLEVTVLTTMGLLAIVDAAPVSAQTVRGTLVEYPGGAPLPGGTLTLLDSAGMPVDSTRSTAAGTFSLRAHTAGLYMLYFTHTGYASVPSEPIRLTVGETVAHRFAVPLISGAAIQRMSEVLDLEKRLQGNLSELCGEEIRSTEAGLLVGVVRRRPGGQPLAGAIVRVEAPARDGAKPFRKATVRTACT